MPPATALQGALVSVCGADTQGGLARSGRGGSGIITTGGTRSIADHAKSAPPVVRILMALYQGERFVQAQLDSIAAQTGVAWDLVVSDDGSDDGGPRIIGEFARAFPGRVTLRSGPGQGAVANFRALILDAGCAEYVALADQDDVWCAEKLSRAVAALAAVPDNTAALYCSRVQICDAQLRCVGLSRMPQRAASFNHALVQNLVQGNTVVLNRPALDLVQGALRLTDRIVMHDWFIYQIVAGAGGTVIYDPRPTLRYRQHDNNVVGANDGWRARFTSLGRMLQGHHSRWSRQTIIALTASAGLLTPDNRALLGVFERLVSGSIAQRIRAMWVGRFYRQGALSQIALWLAAMIGRV